MDNNETSSTITINPYQLHNSLNYQLQLNLYFSPQFRHCTWCDWLFSRCCDCCIEAAHKSSRYQAPLTTTNMPSRAGYSFMHRRVARQDSQNTVAQYSCKQGRTVITHNGRRNNGSPLSGVPQSPDGCSVTENIHAVDKEKRQLDTDSTLQMRSEYSSPGSTVDTYVCKDNSLVIKNSSYVIDCSTQENGVTVSAL